MKLILEAIKSLFRKMEAAIEDVRKAIPKTIPELLAGEKIPGEYVEGMYYTEPDKKEAWIEEQTLTFTDQSGSWPYKGTTTYSSTIADFVYVDHGINEDTTAQMTAEGTVFVVLWDGVEYRCACSEGNGMEMLVIGNLCLSNNTRDDTGEPFCIMLNSYYDSQGLYIIANDTAVKHTMGINRVLVAGEVHQVPMEYVPVLSIEKGGTGADNMVDTLSNFGFEVFTYNGNTISNYPILECVHEELFPGRIFAINFVDGIYVGTNYSDMKEFYINKSKGIFAYTADGSKWRSVDTISGYYMAVAISDNNIVIFT